MSQGHLMITGTGRNGTSFLVRYLAALGLDTEMSRSGERSWDESANAGFEDNSVVLKPGSAPQVLKSPWLYEFLDELLAKGEIKLDAVIIPMRDLVEVSSSRTVLELQAMHASTPWMASFERSWESWGATPGGIVYSLNPLDQARVLALAFHRMVERLVRADIPIVFLDFARLVDDGGYLFHKLRPFLPNIDEATALATHARLANPNKMRVGQEIDRTTFPSHEQLDNAAMRRELARTRAELDRLRLSPAWRLLLPLRWLIQALLGGRRA